MWIMFSYKQALIYNHIIMWWLSILVIILPSTHVNNVLLQFYFNLRSTLTVVCLSLQPTKGGKQMTKLSIQITAMSNLALIADMMLGYLTGLVTATYLSRDMAHRFSIEAVHIHTSTASHIWHLTSPKIHTWNKCIHMSHVTAATLHVTRETEEYKYPSKGTLKMAIRRT